MYKPNSTICLFASPISEGAASALEFDHPDVMQYRCYRLFLNEVQMQCMFPSSVSMI